MNDLNGYLWLVPCRTADAAATLDALIHWFAVFGFVLLWMSDRGSHCKNEVARRVQKELKSQSSFYYGELPVVERQYRVRLHASSPSFLCSAIGAGDVGR
jgi:hypothetical protein